MAHYTHNLKEVNESLDSKEIQIAGWLHNKRNHGGVLFLDIRAFGEKVQVVVENETLVDFASKIKMESVLKIKGLVKMRPLDAINQNLASGKVEVVASEIEIESEAQQVPFQINVDDGVAEDLRLQYRFLDMRTEKMRQNILLRSAVISYIRKRMEDEGFVEFQTPILTASSPEGARDFLVPSRLNPGKFYALPQAPQQFKQMLMASGFEKYFQIAPCFRDEDARADRSPGEFYQLDLEMAFATQEDVFSTMEPVLYDIFAKFGNANLDIFEFHNITGDDDIGRVVELSLKAGVDENAKSKWNYLFREACNGASTYGDFARNINRILEFDIYNNQELAGRNERHLSEYPIDTIMIFYEKPSSDMLDNLAKYLNNKTISPCPFKRITYANSMLKYGNDKPDLRNPIEIFDATDCFEGSKFKIFAEAKSRGEVVRAIPVPKNEKSMEYFKTEMQNFAKLNGAEFGVAYMIFENGTAKPCPIRNAYKLDKNKEEIDETAFVQLVENLKKSGNLKDGDGVFFACGKENFAAKLAGLIRTKIGTDLNLINKNHFEFCWVVDFPFYEKNEETGQIEFSHNPFSMPQGGMDALLNQDPLTIKAYQYDIVCNGIELSSGAIRNHKLDVMFKAFEIAGYSEADVREKFAGMVKAFSYGVPPHGGFAPGVDRMVMLLAGTDSIRDVIPFPLNGKAQDLLMNAPSEVSEKQLRELGLQIRKKTQD